ncbi:hypothetical protein [Serratia nevei]|uniref:hypothetical protein n=1 Tax=Serratia nevei TaxID=2703794 RepID=UPI001A20F695|nr:hypothetical protein [Serratia marcescens]
MKWKTDNSVTAHDNGDLTIVDHLNGVKLTIKVTGKRQRKAITIVYGDRTYPTLRAVSGPILSKVLSLLNINRVKY